MDPAQQIQSVTLSNNQSIQVSCLNKCALDILIKLIPRGDVQDTDFSLVQNIRNPQNYLFVSVNPGPAGPVDWGLQWPGGAVCVWGRGWGDQAHGGSWPSLRDRRRK